ncbi:MULTISPECIES: hypothetical protein [Cysteiniphilum]|uniref:hypothetical protein n=1 Tax=Cysteiniphilum TaxID=2056696 RepID=UPI001782125D|nr:MULTISPECIES: hypothetical protein [Cysteiniphilum]
MNKKNKDNEPPMFEEFREILLFISVLSVIVFIIAFIVKIIILLFTFVIDGNFGDSFLSWQLVFSPLLITVICFILSLASSLFDFLTKKLSSTLQILSFFVLMYIMMFVSKWWNG